MPSLLPRELPSRQCSSLFRRGNCLVELHGRNFGRKLLLRTKLAMCRPCPPECIGSKGQGNSYSRATYLPYLTDVDILSDKMSRARLLASSTCEESPSSRSCFYGQPRLAQRACLACFDEITDGDSVRLPCKAPPVSPSKNNGQQLTAPTAVIQHSQQQCRCQAACI